MECLAALHQIEVCINSLIKMIDGLSEEDLLKRPTEHKHSIGELLEHITCICEADFHISTGATKAEMTDLYCSRSYKTLAAIREGLLANFTALKSYYLNMPEELLRKNSTSYWGVTYTRYEWLLEIVAHLYHHRGQLHAILLHCYNKDPKVNLFE